MKKFLYMLILLVLSTASVPCIQASEQDVTDLMQTFFTYLKEGNTNAILQLFTDPILSEKQDLLQGNRTYAKFLVDTYKDASMAVNQVHRVSDLESAVDVIFYFPDGDPPLRTKFVVKNLEGTYKISSEEVY